jgi:death-on-curing family protein
MMKKKQKKVNEIVVFQSKSGAIELRGDARKKTIWANRMQMAEIFCVNPQAITKHIGNIYAEKELLRKATSSKMELVQNESGRLVKRKIDIYNLDIIISVGYRISSIAGTKFRQWATEVLRKHITEGYTINPKVIRNNYAEFQKAIENIKHLLPEGKSVDSESVLELISAFADTWLSLDAYDKGNLIAKGNTKKSVALTGEHLSRVLIDFKKSLIKKGEATELFGSERSKGTVTGIVGNVMQTFASKALYPTIEEKAAHLLYFMVKNHPFVDGNKRSGAYAFIWFLNQAGILDRKKITSPALTAITLFIAESDPKNKERMIRLVLQLLKK